MAFLASTDTAYLVTKGGGHGNTPTLGAYQMVVQVNLEHFRHVVINEDNSVTIGGGAKFIDLIPVLHRAGREMSK